MTTNAELVDMSDTAITRRLEQVRALYKLMVSLRQVDLDRARSSGSR